MNNLISFVFLDKNKNFIVTKFFVHEIENITLIKLFVNETIV